QRRLRFEHHQRYPIALDQRHRRRQPYDPPADDRHVMRLGHAVFPFSTEYNETGPMSKGQCSMTIDPAILRDYDQARDHAAVFDLSSHSKIELTGADALSFLHNPICTNDVKDLAPGSGREAFFCTPKARVVAHVIINHFHDEGRDRTLLDFVPGMASKV